MSLSTVTFKTTPLAFSGAAVVHDYSDKMTPETRFLVGAPRPGQAHLFDFDVDVFTKASFDGPKSPFVLPVVVRFDGPDAEQFSRYQKYLKRLKRVRFWAGLNPFAGELRQNLDKTILSQRIRLGRMVADKAASAFGSQSDEAQALGKISRAYTRRLNEVWDTKRRRKINKFRPCP